MEDVWPSGTSWNCQVRMMTLGSPPSSTRARTRGATFNSSAVQGQVVGRTSTNDDCRRSAERDLRRTLALLAHHERQAEQLKARAAAYVRTNLDEADAPSQTVTMEQRRVAADAVAEVRGMSRFLENHQGEFAADLLKLYSAVAPLVT